MKTEKKKLNLSVKVLIGLVIGIVVGLFLPADFANTYIKPFGTLFMNLIKMIVVPLVFSSIVVGTCGLNDAKTLGRMGGKTIAYYLCTTAMAVVIGLLAANLFPVGRELAFEMEAVSEAETTSVVDTLLNIVPTNPVKALADGNMLQIICFAIALGIGILMCGEKGTPLLNCLNSLAEAMYSLTSGVMKLAPIAVFALVCPVVATNGPKSLLPMLGIILTVYGACIFHMVVVYSLSVGGIAHVSPVRFFKEAAPAMMFAFSSASSAATIPFSMESSERLGVPSEVRSFILPLGATINMDGTAIYQGVCALFVANAYGASLTLSQQLTIILTCTLASIGTAGVPGAGAVMLTMVLTSVGLPAEGLAMGMVLGIDRILDMARTTVNITGDIACSVVVAASEKKLNRTEN
jgi:Na+/H+-dicarboxylate symporter